MALDIGSAAVVGRDQVARHRVRANGGARLPERKGWEAEEILELLKDRGVRFLRLQFTDITGMNKNVEIPEQQFKKALRDGIMFDGSSIEGFVRIEESDMILKPDLDTLAVFPWGDEDNRVGGIICDVYTATGQPFEGDPRYVLKRQLAAAAELGYSMMAGVEAEFFLFHRNKDGSPTRITHDAGGYFDLTPVDLGEVARRDMVSILDWMGFEVEAGHHEVAPGQHEIDFRYADALITADRLSTFRFVVRNVALEHGLHATFMPKPIFGQAGSGMHTHQSLFKGKDNCFFDPQAPDQLSQEMRWYIGGLLEHARGYCAVTNPLVNSYKRLVPGYEAPVNVAWSHHNRSPMVRVPARRGKGTRIELRSPDPSANPYLALAVQLAAGLDGIRNRIEPPDAVNKNIFELSVRERRRYKIQDLPRHLDEALTQLKRNRLILDVLGPHVSQHFIAAKEAEWHGYTTDVHGWEIDRYLATY